MHCMFLGWLQYFYGSVISILVHDILPEDALSNLQFVGNYIRQHQKEHNVKHRYRHKLTKLTMFQPKKGYARLRGRAADIAGLSQTMLSLFTHCMNNDDLQQNRIRLFLNLNTQLAAVLSEFSPATGHMALPPQQADSASQIALQMAQVHLLLMEHYKPLNRKVFNITSKTHFAIHAVLLGRHLHPHMVWCFSGETTMHRLQTLWKSCLSGVKLAGGEEGGPQGEIPSLAESQALRTNAQTPQKR